MSVAKAVAYVIIATFLVTFSAIALLVGGLATIDSRTIFVLALGVAGLAFGGLAFSALRAIHIRLRAVQA